jgi:hypothetical protein
VLPAESSLFYEAARAAAALVVGTMVPSFKIEKIAFGYDSFPSFFNSPSTDLEFTPFFLSFSAGADLTTGNFSQGVAFSFLESLFSAFFNVFSGFEVVEHAATASERVPTYPV